MKINQLIRLGLIDNEHLVRGGSKEGSSQPFLNRLFEAIFTAKAETLKTNESMRNQICNYKISMTLPAYHTELREMVNTGSMQIGSLSVPLNKQQRYECIRQLAIWGGKVENLFEDEFAKNYSDADELAKKKFAAS